MRHCKEFSDPLGLDICRVFYLCQAMHSLMTLTSLEPRLSPWSLERGTECLSLLPLNKSVFFTEAGSSFYMLNVASFITDQTYYH